jgi:hypothetical protein
VLDLKLLIPRDHEVLSTYRRARNRLEAVSDVLAAWQLVRAFREYDQKLGRRQPVPPAKAREPYGNEVVKR